MTISLGPKLGLLVNAAQGEEHYDELCALLRGIDALLQCTVIDHTLTSPPSSPSDGDCYIVGETGASGAWATHEKKIARYSALLAAWEFYSPSQGWLAWSVEAGAHLKYAMGAWSVLATGGTSPVIAGFDVAQGSCTIDEADPRIAIADPDGGSFYTSAVCRAIGKFDGKRYFEIQSNNFDSFSQLMLFGISNFSLFDNYNQGAHSTSSYGNVTAVVADDSQFKADGVEIDPGLAISMLDPIGFAVNLDGGYGQVWIYQGGVCFNGDAATGTGGAYYGASGVEMFPFVTFFAGSKAANIRLTDEDFTNPPPSGFVAWAS